MARFGSFRDLDVWQRSMDLVDSVMIAARKLPRFEFEFRRQMQSSAMSIPFNIAEGYRRKKRRGAYQNHVSIAMGSQGELETQMEVAFRNNLLVREEHQEMVVLCERVGAMLNRLHDSLD
jgi:carbamoyl-phosphate synthase large subunit